MVLRDRARLVVGSLGLGIVLWGLLVFFGQTYRALETGRFEGVPVRTVLDDRHVRDNMPATVVEWSQRITAKLDAHGPVGWFLDEVPLAVLLIVVGGVTAWKSFSGESSASRRH
jgi:hypothetical protein